MMSPKKTCKDCYNFILCNHLVEMENQVEIQIGHCAYEDPGDYIRAEQEACADRFLSRNIKEWDF